jgi:hypothetical protein
MRKNFLVGLAGCLLALPLCILPSVGSSFEGSEFSVPVQIPYEPPPKAEIPDIPEATPAPTELSEKDRERLESLIPLLEGQQEYWAIGEFVHYGKHSVPYLVKALKQPGPRLRYNAIETLSMIKEPSSVPGLLEVAMDENEMSRIRSHAIRTATRIDPSQVLPAIQEMAKDPNSTIRSTAVFEARRVRQKEILPIIIGVIPDPEQYVSITARDSFWVLTGFIGSPHDWETSTPNDRKEWAKEWWAWWEEHKGKFDSPPPEKPSPKAPENPEVS